MKIELKRISYSKRLSQETSAYAADVWIDGVKHGTVENSGHGGPDMIRPRELADAIDTYAKTLPPTEYMGTKLPMSAEMIFGDLLNDHLAWKDMTRAMKTKTLFVALDGKLYSVKGTVAPSDAKIVLNKLPMTEALKLFRSKTSST